MSPYGAGMVTVLHDPDDDPEITHTALAAHDPQRGQLTVHPTVGTQSPTVLAFDIFGALGWHVSDKDFAGQSLGAATRAYAAAAAWLAADRIEVVIVLRGHLLSPTARVWLARTARTAQTRVIVIWHERNRRNWAEAFRHPPALVNEIEDLGSALAGARARFRPPEPCPTSASLPPLAAVPTCGLARFRADSHRTLPAEQFAALDAHYRNGMQAACRYVAGHELLQETGRRVAPGTDATDAGAQCLGNTLGRGRPFPRHLGDTAGLQGFLSQLAGSSPAPSATVARIRGAQAGMFAHGVALQVPVGLAAARGPGLTGACVDVRLAAAIRQAAPDPQLAAALAIAAFTGAGAREITDAPVAEPRESGIDLRLARTGLPGAPATYRIPRPALPLLKAAAFFLRQTSTGTKSLLDGVDAHRIDQAAAALRINLPAPHPHAIGSSAWHTRTAAWVVGDPLHRDTQCAGRADHPRTAVV